MIRPQYFSNRRLMNRIANSYEKMLRDWLDNCKKRWDKLEEQYKTKTIVIIPRPGV